MLSFSKYFPPDQFFRNTVSQFQNYTLPRNIGLSETSGFRKELKKKKERDFLINTENFAESVS